MGKAAKNMFFANAEECDGYEFTIGCSSYSVSIPSYHLGGYHYVKDSDTFKYFSPIVNAFNDQLFAKAGILNRSLPYNEKSLKNFVSDFYSTLFIEREDYRRFTNAESSLSYKGVWPAVEVLARIAHELQLGRATPEEIKRWFPVVKDVVKNDLGLMDTFLLSARARSLPLDKKLGPDLYIPPVDKPVIGQG